MKLYCGTQPDAHVCKRDQVYAVLRSAFAMNLYDYIDKMQITLRVSHE